MHHPNRADPGRSSSSREVRGPPRWDPLDVHNYSLRRWVADVNLWILECPNMSPSEQIAKLIRSGLGGTAEIIGRQMTSEKLQTGGCVQGIHYDPVTLLIRALEQRFGELEEETRMAAAN